MMKSIFEKQLKYIYIFFYAMGYKRIKCQAPFLSQAQYESSRQASWLLKGKPAIGENIN